MYRRGNLFFCLEVRPITEFSQEFFSYSGKDFVLCLDIELENLVDFSSFPATHLENKAKTGAGFLAILENDENQTVLHCFHSKA